MTNTKVHSGSEKSLLFITGFFGLSTLSTQIMGILHMPYLIELFFVPIILYYHNRNGIRRIKTKIGIKPLFFFFLLFLIISTLIGIVYTGDVFDVITCIRPFIYLSLIAYYCARKKSEFPLEKVYLIVAGALFGELVNKLLFMNSISSIDHINTFALAVFVIIPFIINNKKMIVFSVLFGLIMAVMTLYRREILVYFVALCSGIYFRWKPSNSIKRNLLSGVIYIAAYFIYLHSEDIIAYIIRILRLDDTPAMTLNATYRIIEKFQTMGSASDALRINTWQAVFTDFAERIIPRGPVGKSLGLWYFGAYTDSTNIFMYDVFGSILTWVVVMFICCKIMVNLKRLILNQTQNHEVILSALMIPVFLVCVLMDGTFMVHANISIIAGYAIHGWFVNSQKKKERTRMVEYENTICCK